jgi:hypothetical protein
MNDDAAFMGLMCAAWGVGLAVLVLAIICWWKIFEKAGYGGAMGLLMAVPIVNLVMFLVLAFGEWPVVQEMRRLRRDLHDQDEYGGRRYERPVFGRDPEGEDDPRFSR